MCFMVSLINAPLHSWCLGQAGDDNVVNEWKLVRLLTQKARNEGDDQKQESEQTE